MNLFYKGLLIIIIYKVLESIIANSGKNFTQYYEGKMQANLDDREDREDREDKDYTVSYGKVEGLIYEDDIDEDDEDDEEMNRKFEGLTFVEDIDDDYEEENEFLATYTDPSNSMKNINSF